MKLGRIGAAVLILPHSSKSCLILVQTRVTTTCANHARPHPLPSWPCLMGNASRPTYIPAETRLLGVFLFLLAVGGIPVTSQRLLTLPRGRERLFQRVNDLVAHPLDPLMKNRPRGVMRWIEFNATQQTENNDKGYKT